MPPTTWYKLLRLTWSEVLHAIATSCPHVCKTMTDYISFEWQSERASMTIAQIVLVSLVW